MKEKLTKEISLEDIQKELEILLADVKAKNKLKIGDKFLIDNQILIPGYGEVWAWKKVEIVDIKSAKKSTETTVIYYIIQWEDDRVLEMSKWIFITYFCNKLTIESKNADKKIKKLREQEKFFTKSLEKNETDETDEIDETKEGVKEKVNWLVTITKLLKKKKQKKTTKK